MILKAKYLYLVSRKKSTLACHGKKSLSPQCVQEEEGQNTLRKKCTPL